MSSFAYARVSSKDQNLQRQLTAFSNCGIAFDRIYCDKISGKDFERKNYKKLIRVLKPGDLVVIKSIDRLGRNYEAVIEEWKRITKESQADIVVLDTPLLDTRCSENNLVGKFISDIVLQLLSFVAENERENIRLRQAEGIRAALENGVKFGRPRINLPQNFKTVAGSYIAHKISFSEALRLTSMRPTTFYRYVKDFARNNNTDTLQTARN